MTRNSIGFSLDKKDIQVTDKELNLSLMRSSLPMGFEIDESSFDGNSCNVVLSDDNNRVVANITLMGDHFTFCIKDDILGILFSRKLREKFTKV